MTSHVRRKDKEIADAEILKRILKSTKYVTIALCNANKPYLVSLSHGYDEKQNCIYFHCASEGKKVDYMKQNSEVWGEAIIDRGYREGECDHDYASVHFHGNVVFVGEIDEKRLGLECMIRQLDERPEGLMSKLDPNKLASLNVGKIRIDYMSGKKSKDVLV